MSITDLNAYELARMASVYSPDGPDSPGAKFLVGLRDEIVDLTDESDDFDSELIMDHFRERIDTYLIYTSEVWAVFTDLGAWQNENPFGNGDDMTQNAQGILYGIATDLGYALLTEYEEGLEDEDDLEDEEN